MRAVTESAFRRIVPAVSAEDHGQMEQTTLNERLREAIQRSYLEGLSTCLKHGADPNCLDEFDDSALTASIRKVRDPQLRYRFVEALLKHGADPCLLRDDGGGPLFSGSMSFRVETAYAEGHRGYDEVKGGRSPGEAEPLTSPYPRQRFRKADGGRQPPSAWRTIATFRLYRDRS